MPAPRPRELLLDVLTTQLVTTRVYTQFLRWCAPPERPLWSAMLRDEFRHGDLLRQALEAPDLPSPGESADAAAAALLADLPPAHGESPAVKMEPFRRVGEEALRFGNLSALERVLLALRLEHAELQYGLEGLVLADGGGGRFGLPPSPEPLANHYHALVEAARRYHAAPEVAGQLARLAEHFPELA